MKQKYETFKKSLYNKNINKSELIDGLKIFYNFEEQEYILKRIPKKFPTDQAKSKWEKIKRNIEDVSKSDSYQEVLGYLVKPLNIETLKNILTN